jgi:glyoxylase-like metal-dependent hydrolase (beta-lactamase superfamily II)
VGGIYGAQSPVGVGDTVEHYDLTFRPTAHTEDATTIDLGGDRQLCAVHTPGHASNHFCWLLARSNQPDVLFSGDHIMDGSTVVIPPPDGDMSAYLESLARVRLLAPQRIAPGHGAMITEPLDVIDYYIAHRLRREASIRDRLVATPTGLSINEIVVLEYVGLDDALLWAARYSVWAHLRRLQQLGTVAVDQTAEVDFAIAVWRLTT